MLCDFTLNQVKCILLTCNTIQELAVALGYSKNRSGKTLNKLSDFIKDNGLSTEHFINKNTVKNNLTDDLIFCENTKVSSTTVKKKFIENNLVEYVCVICSNKGEHNGLPLTLQLDHIDGNKKNNKLDNLRLLCPNCHSQTVTFGGRNKSTPAG